MSLSKIAIIFGIVLLIVGILGFIPGITSNGLLLGLFAVNTFHNLVHIITGIIGLLAATQEKYAKLFFQIFGVIYLILGVLGFFMMNQLMMGIQMTMANNILHLVIGLIAVYLGFFFKKVNS